MKLKFLGNSLIKLKHSSMFTLPIPQLLQRSKVNTSYSFPSECLSAVTVLFCHPGRLTLNPAPPQFPCNWVSGWVRPWKHVTGKSSKGRRRERSGCPTPLLQPSLLAVAVSLITGGPTLHSPQCSWLPPLQVWVLPYFLFVYSEHCP